MIYATTQYKKTTKNMLWTQKHIAGKKEYSPMKNCVTVSDTKIQIPAEEESVAERWSS